MGYFAEWIINDKLINTIITYRDAAKPLKLTSIIITYLYIIPWMVCLLEIFIPLLYDNSISTYILYLNIHLNP